MIVLISVALLGLIAIQIYWIQNSIILKDAQFSRNVKIALNNVSEILQEQESSHREQLVKQNFIFRQDSVATAAKPMATQTDTTYLYTDRGEYRLEVVTRSNTSLIHSDSLKQEAKQLPPDNLLRLQGELFERSELLELLSQMVESESSADLSKLYNLEEIDSLLGKKLRSLGGIDAEFQFGIFNTFDQPQFLSEGAEEYVQELQQSEYRVRLYPQYFLQEPFYLRVWFPHQRSYLVETLGPLLFSSALFMLIVIFAFAFTVRTIFRQKKVSEIKNDFINNMTHELKTPIATISLACEALFDRDIGYSEARINQYVQMIRDENKRLGVLVENVLRSAVLDRGGLNLKYQDVDMHEVISNAIKNILIQVEKKNGTINTKLDADKPVIFGDSIHLTNVIYNLIDNAIKYSSEGLQITVSTANKDNNLMIKVMDNGIGISKENQQRIFDKLYRIPTGNVHNIKGYGLGLSYVKVIVEKHMGSIWVESEPGKGSKFIIQLPLQHEL